MNSQNFSNKHNIRYALISGTYFMLYCGPTAFASSFFSGHGYTNSEIAIILLGGSLLTLVTAFAFVIEKQENCRINYGLGRGAGSLKGMLFTAFIATLIGACILFWGIKVDHTAENPPHASF